MQLKNDNHNIISGVDSMYIFFVLSQKLAPVNLMGMAFAFGKDRNWEPFLQKLTGTQAS